MTAQSQEGPAFAAIRRGKLKPGMAEEFVKRVKAGAVPVLTGIAGFRAYYLIFGADDTVTAITLFASKAGAEASNQNLLPWIKENLGPLLSSPPELTEGEVVISKVA